jgi:hypothetical protein
LLARHEWLGKADRPIRLLERAAFLFLPLAALFPLLGLSLSPVWYGVLAAALVVPARVLRWLRRPAHKAKIP